MKSIRRKVNGQTSHVVAAIVFLSPFFYGSNRPFFWLLWSAIVSSVGVIWFLRIGLSAETLRIPLRRMLPVLLPFFVLSLYMAAQIIPIYDLVPTFSSTASPRFELHSKTLSLTPQDSLLAMLRWLTYGLLFFFTVQFCANAARAHQFMRILFWAIVVHAAIGLAMRYQFSDTFFGIEKTSYKGSTTGGFINRNSFATFLSLGGVLGVVQILALWHDNLPHGERKISIDTVFRTGGLIPAFTGWIIILVTLISTNSRMGVFAGCSGMFAVVAIATSRMPTRNRTSFFRLGLVALPLIIAFSVGIYGEAFLSRLGRLESGDDIAVRMRLYQQTLDMISHRYFLGYGGQSFEYAFPLFHDPSFAVNFLWDKAHSTYLTLWVEYGVFFGSLPILLTCFLLFYFLKSFSQSQTLEAPVLAGIGAIIVVGLHSLVDFSLEIEAVTFAFTIIIAVSYSRALEARRADSKE